MYKAKEEVKPTPRSFTSSSRTAFTDFCPDRFFWATGTRCLFLVFLIFRFCPPQTSLPWLATTLTYINRFWQVLQLWFIFPLHLSNASTLPYKTQKQKIASFHLNVVITAFPEFNHSLIDFFNFYPRDAMLPRVLAVIVCPSVCPYVCHTPV